MQSKLKVCHIVNWYPNPRNEKEAIWTRKHILALNKHCDNDVFHIQVIEGKIGVEYRETSSFEKAYVLRFPTRIWFIKEILTTLLLIYVLLFKLKRKEYDLFNFQITYPLLTYSKIICLIVRKPIVVTEHWSAYHLNFGVTKNLKRIKRIFANRKLNFICVSEALVKDIEQFSGYKINYSLVPNVINERFQYLDLKKDSNTFFMLSYWKKPKDPFLMLKVFKELKNQNFAFHLVIGGYGPMLEDMKKTVGLLELNDNVEFVGELEEEEIILEFNKNDYFIHNSNYEVASVVCSESLCCGTPVIASAVGGIVEYVTKENGILVSENTFDNWFNSIRSVISESRNFNSKNISENASKRFHSDQVGIDYYNALKNVVAL
jgi:glycosyltransferase involved in cell wall biosynthesis